MHKSTYIIIVTYNGMLWIDTCLNSCCDHQIIIVDNASTDETISFIETKYPRIILLKQNTNIGFGQANNIGISHALNQGAEHVFLLNQDAYLVGDVLENLISFQKSHPNYGIVSPIHINNSGTRLDKSFANYLNHDINPNFFSDHVLNRTLKPIYEIPFVNAAGWLISKQCLLEVGGFDPLFFHYGEDNNYCQRVLYHQFKIGVVPNTYIIHDREDRVQQTIKRFDDAYFELATKKFKSMYANITTEHIDQRVYGKIRIIRKKSWYALFQFRFKDYKGYNQEYRLLKKLAPKILHSCSINIVEGAHYLNLDSKGEL